MKYFLRIVLVFGIGFFVVFSVAVAWVLGNHDHQFEGKADCAVVFGAAVWRGDIPSHALYDRTVTALDMYQTDQVECLVFSGGASEQGSHEVDVMKKLALEVGVPEEDMVLDYEGVNTLATVKGLVDGEWLMVNGKEEVDFVLVSNDFHLGRIRMMGWKYLDQPFDLQTAKYHYGRYGKEKFFFWREVLAVVWYGVFVW